MDRHELHQGLYFAAGFCSGLIKITALCPVMSRPGIKAQFEALGEGSLCDNVLLEHRLALELKTRGLIERVFPLLVGDCELRTKQFSNYSRSGCAPERLWVAAMASVEDSLNEHLDA